MRCYRRILHRSALGPCIEVLGININIDMEYILHVVNLEIQTGVCLIGDMHIHGQRDIDLKTAKAELWKQNWTESTENRTALKAELN